MRPSTLRWRPGDKVKAQLAGWHPAPLCDDDQSGCYQDKQVPIEQGIFVHDLADGTTRTVAKTGARFDEFYVTRL